MALPFSAVAVKRNQSGQKVGTVPQQLVHTDASSVRGASTAGSEPTCREEGGMCSQCCPSTRLPGRHAGPPAMEQFSCIASFCLQRKKKLSPVTHLILPTGQETVKREIKKIPIILCIPNAPFIRSIPQSFPASGCFPRPQAAAGEGTSLAFVLGFTFRSPQGRSALPHSAHILEGNAGYFGARASP